MLAKSDKAYEFLREKIISTEIAPNAPLRISSLGAESTYGSTPVREALRLLESEKFVVSTTNAGFRAAPISLEELKDLEESRLVIESSLLVSSIKGGGDEWESRIIAAHYQLEKIPLPIDTDDPVGWRNWAVKHQAFHDALLSGAKSRWLNSFQKQIALHLERHYNYTLGGTLRSRFKKSKEMTEVLRRVLGIDHHTILMRATLNRDIEQSVRLLEEHIGFASRTFIEVFSPSEQGAACQSG